MTAATLIWTTLTRCVWPDGSDVGPRAYAKVKGIPVIDCERGERKHLIVEDCLATHQVAGACS